MANAGGSAAGAGALPGALVTQMMIACPVCVQGALRGCGASRRSRARSRRRCPAPGTPPCSWPLTAAGSTCCGRDLT